jgi:hypothetical protein
MSWLRGSRSTPVTSPACGRWPAFTVAAGLLAVALVVGVTVLRTRHPSQETPVAQVVPAF